MPENDPNAISEAAAAEAAAIAAAAAVGKAGEAHSTGPAAGAAPGTMQICPQCHLPIPKTAYFCPNCGKELGTKPLSTSIATQIWIYAFSIFLPMIAYLAISYWPAIKYLKSEDERAKQIGIIAVILLVASTVITFWLTIVWIQNYVQQSVNDIGNLGNLGGL